LIRETGVFVDSLERSLVGPEYYAALGQNASINA